MYRKIQIKLCDVVSHTQFVESEHNINKTKQKSDTENDEQEIKVLKTY